MAFTASVQVTAQSISSLHRDFLAPMTPGPMINDLLEATFHPEVQAPRIAEIIESNPLYAHYLQKLDILQEKVKQWRDESPDDKTTERLTKFIVVLLGPTAIRNAILAIWLTRHSSQGLPKKEGVPFLVVPKTQLRFSMQILEYCDDNHIAHTETAYYGALCYDWLALLFEKKGGSAKSEKKYLDELWPQAVKAARLAYELAALPGQMNLSEYTFPAVLLVFLGKALMAASFPKGAASDTGWKEFVKHCDSHGPRSRLAYRLLEQRLFPWTHSEAAALCSLAFPKLAPAEKGIRYYLEPQMLKYADHESFELALVISAAVTLSTRGKGSLSDTQKTELSKIRITEQAINTMMDRIVKKK